MKHQEIRFHILHYLYNKHYGGELGKYQVVDKIIPDTELKNVERNLVIGDVAYLYDGKFIKGTPIMKELGYPTSILIANYGIDAVDKVINHIIKNVTNPERVHDPGMQQKHQNEIRTISDDDNPKNKINGIWSYVKSNPSFFATYVEKAVMTFLTTSGGDID